MFRKHLYYFFVQHTNNLLPSFKAQETLQKMNNIN
jgi:hypothetical protein